MTLLLLGLLTGNALAALVAWQMAGALGAGAALGFALGSAVSALGAYLALGARNAPGAGANQALAVFVGFFLLKLVLIAAGGALLRYLEPAAAIFDWRAYLVAFGLGVLWILALDSVREVRTIFGARTS